MSSNPTVPQNYFCVVEPLTIDPKLDCFSLVYADSYKGSHGLMLKDIFRKDGVKNVQFYAGPRIGSKFPEVVNFGLQSLLKKLANTIITEDHVFSVASLFGKGLGDFDIKPWIYVARDLNGVMPIKISALPEGAIVPEGVPLFTIESIDEKFSPVLGYFETFMSHLWYPMTVATHSREVKKIIKNYVNETSMNLDSWKFMLHDFGCRGVSSMETAGIGGAAHLVSFYGTDTIPAFNHISNYYGCSSMPGFSVNASEHSIMTSKGLDGQYDVLEKLLTCMTQGILSLVIDSYNQYDVTEKLTTDFLPLVIARNGKLVLRPDSGDPLEVIEKLFEILERNLSEKITINEKGYKQLPSYFGIIYGDGLNPKKIEELLEKAKILGWASDNIVFGMGGGLLQKVDRDTCRFAWKCCALQTSDDVWHDVFKDPCDGKGTSESKASFRGRIKVIKIDGTYKAVREDDSNYVHLENDLKPVYENGVILKEYTFEEVRANAEVISNSIYY
jgi:nicotinamide phosphoribosyltransferase